MTPTFGGDFDCLMNVADLKSEIDFFALADGQGDVGAPVGLEARFRCGDFVVADGQRGGVESARFIGDEGAAAAGFQIDDRYRGAGDRGAGRIGDRAPERDFALRGKRRED